ncbi:hypothetical protein AFE_1225 [Acidithiobacillus ferrooxidans ATCC 23270]|uniref:Uncharacterized protein n=1 Tax=Acidithiobacillus ferrooxidans (strain ATCC 23270 / DSM 14882 / CIP 104768 / NCIMB 8455) TaxID=243159 RepID=B7J8Q7_ACIF2|nr:hypothetical protein AFE_1225 [Acidithiobacillus ferrooxidans ATCC 23270]
MQHGTGNFMNARNIISNFLQNMLPFPQLFC